ncbi:MAG TPA: YbaY family lipoprotein [Gemmatimonadaceae bacterium]
MADQETRVVRGSFTAPEGTPSTPITLIVQVEDVSRADAPSLVVAELRRSGVRLSPGDEVPFEVDVPAGVIDPKHHYSVRVHVDASGSGNMSRGDLITTQSYPVLTWGHGTEVRPQLRRI